MGFSVELFVNQPVDEELICSICLDVLRDPVMVDAGCEHAFCKECINNYNEISPIKNLCPLDRNLINGIMAPPRLMITLLNRLKIYCQFKKFGCGEIQTLERILDHEQNCRFNPDNFLDCPANCGATLFKPEQQLHNCMEYLLGKVKQQAVEISELKRDFQAKVGKIKDGGGGFLVTAPLAAAAAEPVQAGQQGQDNIWAICISEEHGGLKLGETIEILKEKVGKNTHLGIKNGIKRLVRDDCVRIMPYEEIVGEREIAQCISSRSFPSCSRMLSFNSMDIIEIICKDVTFWDPDKQQTKTIGWLGEMNGKVGYFIPAYARIVQ